MWDPEQYLRFERERARPFFDLVGRIPVEDPQTVVDLGCGPGGLTATLLERYPRARIWGIDLSSEMIAHAGRRQVPDRLSFELADVAVWRAPQPVEVMISNACFHWVRDHSGLLGHLLGQLAGGGVLAFQVPDNSGEPSHRLLRELVENDPVWSSRLVGVKQPAVHDIAWYVAELSRRGCRVDGWETTYHQVLPGVEAVLEWVRGSTLRPILRALDSEEEQQGFLDAYLQQLRRAYRPHSFGTLFPFRRIFIVAQRGY